jgi:hypothetical protein
MNEIYHWQDQVMVRLEMDDFKREMDTIRLINDAGLSNPGLLEKLAIAIGKALARMGDRLYKRYTEPQQAYQVTSCKYAA